MESRSKIFTFFQKKTNYDKVVKKFTYLFGDKETAREATQGLILKLVDSSKPVAFPEDEIEQYRYIIKSAVNYFFEQLRKNKHRNMSLDDTTQDYGDEVMIQRKTSSVHKLDLLNSLIQDRRHLFTEDQLKLWQCMYQCLSIEKIEKMLGKSTQTIYSLRNKLRDKIRKHIRFEELTD